MERHQTDAPEQTAWHSPRRRPACPQWHLLGLAVGRAVARPPGNLWTLHDLLQPLCPLAAGWRLGPYGCARMSPRPKCRFDGRSLRFEASLPADPRQPTAAGERLIIAGRSPGRGWLEV